MSEHRIGADRPTRTSHSPDRASSTASFDKARDLAGNTRTTSRPPRSTSSRASSISTETLFEKPSAGKIDHAAKAARHAKKAARWKMATIGLTVATGVTLAVGGGPACGVTALGAIICSGGWMIHKAAAQYHRSLAPKNAGVVRRGWLQSALKAVTNTSTPATPSTKAAVWAGQHADHHGSKHLGATIIGLGNDKKYAGLNNLHPAAVTYGGESYTSSEHAYQMAKFAHLGTDTAQYRDIKKVICSKEGQQVPISAWFYRSQIDPDWNTTEPGATEPKNVRIMRDVIAAKFADNPPLKRILLKTGDAVLVDNTSKNDNFWGVGHDGTGKNWLGRILMETRQNLMSPPHDYGDVG